MVNKANIDKVIARLENEVDDQHFHMKVIFGRHDARYTSGVTIIYNEDAPKVIHDCNTVMCIAGHTIAEIAKEFPAKYWQRNINSIETPDAADYLGISNYHDGTKLFCPPGFVVGYDLEYEFESDPNGCIRVIGEKRKYYTRKRAIAVLKHLRDTGEVNWHKFDENGNSVE